MERLLFKQADPTTIINNKDFAKIRFVEDPNLSWEEKGLIQSVYLLTLNNAEYYIDGVMSRSKEDEGYIRSTISDLIEKGYTKQEVVGDDIYYIFFEVLPSKEVC